MLIIWPYQKSGERVNLLSRTRSSVAVHVCNYCITSLWSRPSKVGQRVLLSPDRSSAASRGLGTRLTASMCETHPLVVILGAIITTNLKPSI